MNNIDNNNIEEANTEEQIKENLINNKDDSIVTSLNRINSSLQEMIRILNNISNNSRPTTNRSSDRPVRSFNRGGSFGGRSSSGFSSYPRRDRDNGGQNNNRDRNY